MTQFVVLIDWEGTWYLWTILMYTFVFLLMCFELAQFYVLHRLYLKEIENWIEWIVFISAACTPLIKVTSESFCLILTCNYICSHPSSFVVVSKDICLQEIYLP